MADSGDFIKAPFRPYVRYIPMDLLTIPEQFTEYSKQLIYYNNNIDPECEGKRYHDLYSILSTLERDINQINSLKDSLTTDEEIRKAESLIEKYKESCEQIYKCFKDNGLDRDWKPTTRGGKRSKRRKRRKSIRRKSIRRKSIRRK